MKKITLHKEEEIELTGREEEIWDDGFWDGFWAGSGIISLVFMLLMLIIFIIKPS